MVDHVPAAPLNASSQGIIPSTAKDELYFSSVKFEAISASEMASVLTTESVETMDLKPGDSVELIIKAIHVLPVKE